MIFRGRTLTNTDGGGASHRVKVVIDGVWEDKSQIPYIEVMNGMYLRKNEDVYVYVSPEYDSAIVLGRAENWLDAHNMTDLINSLIDQINETRKSLRSFMQAYANHTHGGVYSGACTTTPANATPGNTFVIPQKDVPLDMKKITVDNIIEK